MQRTTVDEIEGAAECKCAFGRRTRVAVICSGAGRSANEWGGRGSRETCASDRVMVGSGGVWGVAAIGRGKHEIVAEAAVEGGAGEQLSRSSPACFRRPDRR